MSSSRGGTGRADFNAKVINEFRANGGYVSERLADTPLMLVHHLGARSRTERVVPLAYLRQPDGRFLVIASNGGCPTHPAWYHNLKANPEATVEVGAETFRVVAEELDPVARSVTWPTIVEQAPAAGEFQNMSARTLPVFMLTREK
ncbi:MAG: ddn3 [Acidimicrobiaceae bacterium]|nr:ddn3 [Acidimicrobiaceae bacterium]